ncbi:unnamed protein product [Symbiodinium sp. CCMP2592]|nr:unnamed protein product [Symbiodinium sp. CCMP2592]
MAEVHASQDLPDGEGARVGMFSARFDGKETEQLFRRVYKLLKSWNYPVLMVDAKAGKDFGDYTAMYLGRLLESRDGVMLSVCTWHYGEVTKSKYSSYEELKFAYGNDIEILPLRLCDMWPPKPDFGPNHACDKEGLANGFLNMAFPPSKVFVDCRGKDEHWIAAQIAEALHRPAERDKADSGEVEVARHQDKKDPNEEARERLLDLLEDAEEEEDEVKLKMKNAPSHSKRIVVIGGSGVGKSSFCGILDGTLRKGEDKKWTSSFKLGHGANSETNTPDLRVCNWRGHSGDGELPIVIMDTPGMEDTRGPAKDLEHMAKIAEWINSIEYIHLLLLLVDSSVRITDSLRRILEFFQERFGKEMWRHTMVVVNKWQYDERTMDMREDGDLPTCKQFEEEFRKVLQLPTRREAKDGHAGLGLTEADCNTMLRFSFVDTLYRRQSETESAAMENELAQMQLTLRCLPNWKVRVQAQSPELKQLMDAVRCTNLAEELKQVFVDVKKVGKLPEDVTDEKLKAVEKEVERRSEFEKVQQALEEADAALDRFQHTGNKADAELCVHKVDLAFSVPNAADAPKATSLQAYKQALQAVLNGNSPSYQDLPEASSKFKQKATKLLEDAQTLQQTWQDLGGALTVWNINPTPDVMRKLVNWAIPKGVQSEAAMAQNLSESVLNILDAADRVHMKNLQDWHAYKNPSTNATTADKVQLLTALLKRSEDASVQASRLQDIRAALQLEKGVEAVEEVHAALNRFQQTGSKADAELCVQKFELVQSKFPESVGIADLKPFKQILDAALSGHSPSYQDFASASSTFKQMVDRLLRDVQHRQVFSKVLSSWGISPTPDVASQFADWAVQNGVQSDEDLARNISDSVSNILTAADRSHLKNLQDWHAYKNPGGSRTAAKAVQVLTELLKRSADAGVAEDRLQQIKDALQDAKADEVRSATTRPLILPDGMPDNIPDGLGCRVGMFCCRFDGTAVEHRFRQVYQVLKDMNYAVLMVEAAAGPDYVEINERYLQQIKEGNGVLLAVCSQHFAEVTSSPASSYGELRFAYDHDVDILPLKCDDCYPPDPPSGPDHPYDKAGKARKLIALAMPPTKVFLDCRDRDVSSIAAQIAEVLHRPPFREVSVPDRTGMPLQVPGIPNGMGARTAVISARFDGGEMEKTFRAVHKLLWELNYTVHMVTAMPGQDFGEMTARYLQQIKEGNGVLLAVCTHRYAEVTSSPASSYEDLRFAYDHDVDILPLKCDDWYPPDPPWGRNHPYDKAGKARKLIALTMPPTKVFLDCRDRDVSSIAAQIAEVLHRPPFREVSVPDRTGMPLQVPGIPNGMGARTAVISARFDGGEMEKTFRAVHKLLWELNYTVHMVTALPGQDFGEMTARYLQQIKEGNGVLLAVCTHHYAEVTSSPVSSYEDLRFAHDDDVDILPLRCDDCYPPDPPWGPNHPYDKAGKARKLIALTMPPTKVFLDCRGRDVKSIAAQIAEVLHRPPFREVEEEAM